MAHQIYTGADINGAFSEHMQSTTQHSGHVHINKQILDRYSDIGGRLAYDEKIIGSSFGNVIDGGTF